MMYWSFKDIDERHGAVKGTAFRAFKRLQAELREGEDFVYLNAQTENAWIDALRQAGRIYPSTVNLVLLTPQGYARLVPLLPSPAP